MESIAFASGSRTIHTDDLFCRTIHDWNYRQRVGVEVRIFIVLRLVLSENQALHISTVIVGEIQSTVGPGLNDYIKAFRKIKFCQRLLEERRGLATVDKDIEFIAIKYQLTVAS